jgi:hypothetical protein
VSNLAETWNGTASSLLLHHFDQTHDAHCCSLLVHQILLGCDVSALMTTAVSSHNRRCPAIFACSLLGGDSSVGMLSPGGPWAGDLYDYDVGELLLVDLNLVRFRSKNT